MSKQKSWGKPREPKPRPILPPEHSLGPQIEGIIKSKADLRDYAKRGGNPSTEVAVMSTDPTRMSVPVPKLCLAALMQCGIPLDQETYPAVGKLDSRIDANHYHLVYSGPIPWRHDANWRHIPCFTRYVIDKFGRVLNAYNGLQIGDEKSFLFELVPDGNYNGTGKVSKQELLQLAFHPLPEGFKDYGFRTYSHVWGINFETGAVGWIPRPKVRVKNNDNGVTDMFPNLPEFLACADVPFDDRKEWNQYVRQGTQGKTITIGNWMVKEDIPLVEQVHIPRVEVPREVDPFADNGGGDTMAPASVTHETTTASGNGWDDDIPF